MSSPFNLNKPTTNIFGQPGTLGGTTPTNAPSNSVLGGQQQQQQPQQQPQQASSIFGGSFSNPSPFGGLQGNAQSSANTAGSTLFSGTSPFSQPQNQNQAQNPTPSLFSGLGGQTPQNVSSFSNIGGQTQPQPQNQNQAQNPTPFPFPALGGQPQQNPSPFSNFGGQTQIQPQNQNPTPFPFPALGGQPQQNPSPFPNFGGQTQVQPQNHNQAQNPNPSPFPNFGGQNQPQLQNPPASSGFGTIAPGSRLFPHPTTTFQSRPFGTKPPLSSSFLPGVSTSTVQQTSQPDMQQRVEAIVAAWNPQSPQCRFQHYFYNLVDPRQVHLYGRPANAINDAQWQQAVRENPDPSSMVPVLAIGFDDLQKRVEAQSSLATQHNEKLKELQTRLAALSQTHILSNTLRTTRALQTYMLITHRLLRFVEHLHLLIPSLRSAAISPEEEALRARLERLRDELMAGASRGRLNEVWALMGVVRAAKEREIGAGGDGVQWKVVDWEGLEQLGGILSEQQQGLAHLTSIINNGWKDLKIMESSAPQNSEPTLSA